MISSADIVSFETEDAHGRVADAASGEWALDAAPNLCTKPEGCECPAGITYSGPPTSPGSKQFELAVTGGSEGTTGRLVGHSLDEFCKPEPVCTEAIPAGVYDGTVVYATTSPLLTHDGSGDIRFTVDADGSVKGSWDLAYVSKSSTGETGTGKITDGMVSGTARGLVLAGTNVVATSHDTGTTLPFPETPLTVLHVCDGSVAAEWVRTINGVRQQLVVEADLVP